MDFEKLVWLAVIAFWIFGLGSRKKKTPRRTGVPGSAPEPSPLPAAERPQPAREVPGSLEEALRQIREALGETSAPPRPAESGGASSGSEPWAGPEPGTFHAETRPAPPGGVTREPGRVPERKPFRTPERRPASREARSATRSDTSSSTTYDDRFGEESGAREDDFVSLEDTRPTTARGVKPSMRETTSPVMAGLEGSQRTTPREGVERSTSVEDLRQAIVWSEILGPPKARR